VTPGVSPGPAQNPERSAGWPQKGARSVLAQLLHALNQPLTGLQCSMEVALATPRTVEQYVRSLREGLELTERMRILVEAIREVADIEAESGAQMEMIELKALLREVVDDLAPVAKGNSVCMTLDCAGACSLQVKECRPIMAATVFRLVESALSLAATGTELRIEAGSPSSDLSPELWIRLQWNGGRPRGAFSRSELGLLIAQAGWERVGAHWDREKIETLETVTIRLPAFSGSREF
jgi:signal transduction histidine kinase